MTSNDMGTSDLKNTADQYFHSGQLPEALDAYTRLCDLNPRSVHAWHMRAAIHGLLGQFQDTAHCCEEALSINTNAAPIYVNYANALIELGRHDDAILAIQYAIKLNPADVNNLVKLGNIHKGLNNLAEAETCFRNALSLDPANRVLLMTLLEGYFRNGDLDKAYQQILSSRPSIPNIAKPLYRVCKELHDRERYAEETGAIQTVLKVFPDDDYFKLLLADCQIKQDLLHDAAATLEQLSDNDITLEACLLLAKARDDIGQSEKAKAQLVETVRNYPDEEIPVALLSRKLVESGEYDAAGSLLEKFLERHPDSHKLLVELGSINELNGNNALAEQHYKQAIATQPGYAIAHDRLGTIYRIKRQDSLAQECFEDAIRCDPDLLTARCNLAHMYFSNGFYSKAEDYYDRILRIAPDYETAVAGKAAVLERIGRVTEALKLVEPFIQHGTENIHMLLTYASACHDANREAMAAELLEQRLDHPGISQDDRMQAFFVLGKLLDRLGHYEKAFLNYQHGNELNQFPFDRNAHLRLVDSIQSVFSPENMKVFPRSTNPADDLVFIVGMPRSGTTLTEQILASHPDVFGAGELSHIRNIAAAIPEASGSLQPFPLYMPSITQKILDQFAVEHVHALRSLADGQQFITDKMPSNFMFLGLIELLFPNARILHCVRDPMDTCLSCYFQNFSRGQYFSYNQSDLAFFYTQYQQIMSHWKSSLSIPIMDIQYEQLVGDQERMTRDMLEFIGLGWDADCLDFHKSGRKIRTASYHQVRKPVYSSSIKRWKKYESHLTELKNALSESAR